MSIEKFREDVNKGRRFEFGKNWKYFHSKISERISISQLSLSEMLDAPCLSDKTL